MDYFQSFLRRFPHRIDPSAFFRSFTHWSTPLLHGQPVHSHFPIKSDGGSPRIGEPPPVIYINNVDFCRILSGRPRYRMCIRVTAGYSNRRAVQELLSSASSTSDSDSTAASATVSSSSSGIVSASSSSALASASRSASMTASSAASYGDSSRSASSSTPSSYSGYSSSRSISRSKNGDSGSTVCSTSTSR